MDSAARQTEKKLKEVEKTLEKLYKDSQADITKAWKEYMAAQNAYVKDLQEAYQNAKLYGTDAEVREIGKELGVAKAERTLQNQHYKDMVEATTEKLAEVNQTALAYINNEMPWVYATNFNQAVKDAEKVGFNFHLVDEATVKRRIIDGDITTPFMVKGKHLNIPKDMRWNTKQLNSSVLQGIVNGESMQKIADRILPVVNNNTSAAIRNARTMVTGAQNEGRQDSYEYMQDNGVVLNKVWMATHDETTRISHAELDGEEVGVDEKFPNGLMYPGDPDGEPEEVYNCRCTMVTKIIGFRKADGRIEYVNIEGYEPDYEFEQLKGKEPEKPEFFVVNGEDISMTWVRRPDEFDFEIEDIINAQGFDGLPRVVSAEEFDRYVQEANGGKGFIAQRTYSAPDQETLDAYRDQLYNGKWYVDCSTGGAQYGQGMYCAADYTGKLTDGIKAEMEHYKSLGEDRYPKAVKEARDAYMQKQIDGAGSELERVALKEKIYGNTTESEWELYSTRTREQDRLFTKRAREIEEQARGIHGFDYTETITLDPSAKIISFQDLRQEEKMFVESYYNDAVFNATKEMSDIEQAMFRYTNAIESKADRELINAFRESNNDTYRDLMEEHRESWKQVHRDIRDKVLEYERMDDGAFAAMRGYDAIDAEGHGESGSYTAILNRTKVIIKGE